MSLELWHRKFGQANDHRDISLRTHMFHPNSIPISGAVSGDTSPLQRTLRAIPNWPLYFLYAGARLFDSAWNFVDPYWSRSVIGLLDLIASITGCFIALTLPTYFIKGDQQ